MGLTGPLGAGKSEVARVWQSRGAGMVEGDEMGRRALGSDPRLRQRLVERFGREILDPGDQINRGRLARAAFATPQGTADLTSITFPTLYRLASAEMARLARRHRVVVFDAALIFEWGVQGNFDLTVAVVAPFEALLRRAMARLGLGQAEARGRLAAQLSADEKAQRADRVLVNDGDLDGLRRKAAALWDEIAVLAAEKEKGATKAP